MAEDTITAPAPNPTKDKGMSSTMISGAREKAQGYVAGLMAPEGWLGKVGEKGWVGAARDNFNPKAMGNSTPMVFGRVLGTGVGVYMAGDALLRSKTSSGEDRGFVGRLLQFIVGGGVAVASAAAGKAR
jgi:hypothetical protein